MSAHIRHRGFTLIEVMVAVTILGVLAVLAVTTLVYGTGRSRLNNAAFEVSSLLSVAQLRASSTGVPHYVIFSQEGALTNVYLLERADDASAPIDWSTVDLSSELEHVGGRVRDRIALSRSDTATVDLAALNASRLPVSKLPEPFAAIPLAPGDTSTPLAQACSFCVSTGTGARGVIRFSPDGTVRILTATALAGGVLALRPDTAGERGQHTRLVVISAPAGVVRVF